jgi:selenocysteine lyase/cysteine desulfurase
MTFYADNFGPFGEVAWINAAHQGALPKLAVAAAEEAINWKRSPYPMINSRIFSEVPQRQREALGLLINCPAEDIIIGNSASYGLHLLANGIRWQQGDEVLVVEGDFPATILPWMGLTNRGVTVRSVSMENGKLNPEALDRAIQQKTKVFCASWVFSFWGSRLNLPSISDVCRAKGVKVVLNCSQGVGGIPFDVCQGYADSLTCVGFKWLCGPYGTGFCWFEPELRESLDYNQAYWLAMQTAEDLKDAQNMPVIKNDLGARKYDVFGTASFFNIKPWTETVKLLLEIGIDNIWDYNQSFIQRLIDGLDSDSFEVISPTDPAERSNILIISHRDAARNQILYDTLLQHQIFISLRIGRLRFSPHLYNTFEEINRALAILNN